MVSWSTYAFQRYRCCCCLKRPTSLLSILFTLIALLFSKKICMSEFSYFSHSSGANLSQEICFHLHALGPNCSSISKCDCSEQTASYIPQLFKNVVCFSGVSTDTLVGINQVNLDTARVSAFDDHYDKEFPILLNLQRLAIRNAIWDIISHPCHHFLSFYLLGVASFFHNFQYLKS